MDEGLVFHKTELGHDEVAHPGGKLSPKVRRCLILVDGEKSLLELGAVFRPGEIGPIVKELVAGGFIAADGLDASGLDNESAGISEANFVAVRQRAMREVSDRLGPNGDPLAVRLSACETAADLRVVVHEAARIMGQFLGPAYETEFLRKVGAG